MTKVCFVAMPITTPATYIEKFGDGDHFTHVLDHLFHPALEEVGYKTIPPTALGSELIHAEIIKNLEQADLVLCDLSSLNPNVFFELGIRTSLDRPVAIVKDNLTSQIPFDLNAINTLTYDGSLTPWALTKEIPRLVNHIKKAVENDDKGNAMWHYFGLTKRAAPSVAGANPIEEKLDLLLNELTKTQTRSAIVAQNTRDHGVYTSRYRELADNIKRFLSPLEIHGFISRDPGSDTEITIGIESGRISPAIREEITEMAAEKGFRAIIVNAPESGTPTEI